MPFVGTSGWNYPSGAGTWNGIFYPARRSKGFDELAYYAEHFDTVEVNSTFYRMPEPDLSKGWIRRTPPSFVFAVKLFQKFTHPDMYLAREGVTDWDLSRTDLELFRRGVDPLLDRSRLAAVLVQFPTRFHAEPDTCAYLAWLLEGLHGYPLAVELRHASWDAAALELPALLAAHGAARAVTDSPVTTPEQQDRTADSSGQRAADLLYIRLHGRNREQWWRHDHRDDRYDFHYSAAELAPIAERARAGARAGRKVLLYLNNHFSAKAVANAAVLKHQLDQLVPGDYPAEMLARYPELQGIVTTSGLPL